jgi:hypothetical protein
MEEKEVTGLAKRKVVSARTKRVLPLKAHPPDTASWCPKNNVSDGLDHSPEMAYVAARARLHNIASHIWKRTGGVPARGSMPSHRQNPLQKSDQGSDAVLARVGLPPPSLFASHTCASNSAYEAAPVAAKENRQSAVNSS